MNEPQPLPTNPAFRNLAGRTFGKLLVIRFARINRKRQSMWLCRCSCGRLREVQVGNLKRIGSQTKDCKHAKLGTLYPKERHAWRGMIDRCHNGRCRDFPRWGGRGIIVCERWRESFDAFVEDMGLAPARGSTIDRIDNDGPYSPENCRWATVRQQARNRRSSRLITFRGQTRSLAEWVEVTGISRTAIKGRLRLGWPVEEALTVPMGTGGRNPHRGK